MNLLENHSPLEVPAVNLRKRTLLMFLATLPAACAIPSVPSPHEVAVAGPAIPPTMRLPQLGQEWVYTLTDVYTGQERGILTEKVVAVGDKIQIQRSSNVGGALLDETQGPWGMIVQDPHWTPVPTFSPALPLWPLELKAGWSGEFHSRYRIVGQSTFDYDWLQSMQAVGWEEITTPAGKFQALKFTNLIHYQSDELVFRLSSERTETLWLVPEIGRWAIRRSAGTYLIEIRGGDVREDFLEWRLQSWK
ncbi:MAG: hypothetical protein ACYDCF_08410 [Burkholderiales bacterium]|nr:hypothetical protein [Ferrovum sp.]